MHQHTIRVKDWFDSVADTPFFVGHKELRTQLDAAIHRVAWNGANIARTRAPQE